MAKRFAGSNPCLRSVQTVYLIRCRLNEEQQLVRCAVSLFLSKSMILQQTAAHFLPGIFEKI